MTNKVLLLLCAFFILPNPAVAQGSPFDQGSMIVSGSFSLTSTESGDERATSLGIAPGLSYFVVPGLAVGGASNVSGFFRDQTTSVSFGLGPQLMYFFNAPSGEAATGRIERDDTTNAFGLVGGLTIFLP